jgi:QLQ
MEIEIPSLTSKQIKSQILAYKYLIRNLSLPPSLENMMCRISKSQNQRKEAKKSLESKMFNKEKYEKNEMVKWIIQEKMTRNTEQPETSPPPNQPNEQQTLRYFIEKNGFFVEKRKNEIYNYLQNGNLHEEQIVKLNCELKMLENKDFYLKLRSKILADLKNNNEKVQFLRGFESNLLDRSMYRREKPLKKMEGI